ncbi:thiol:disulfide interchange protein DsbD [bacterium MnTg02]|nr:thiol:disulfide interchange protein DsbD [bacterium MnTg02]
MKQFVVTVLITLFSASSLLAGAEPQQDRKQNRLAKEASPYLRQHADNPIDWYPWSKEAFEKARKEHKPIFLSVGYSTCHWCHVMERESFEKIDVADILNKYFVAIKVDRERRPDVDETYMIATELINRSAGWPNSVFLTPELKPFFAGTYFPHEQFKQILNAVAGQWETNITGLMEDAEKIAGAIDQVMTRRVSASEVTPEALNNSAASLLERFDSKNGGFSGAPKFPQESLLLFLLRLAERDGNEAALKAVRRTIDGMIRGGIHDQIGGGFHRYSVDSEWRVPHFEKMLYNQALIGQVLIRAYRLTGSETYASAIRRTLDFVLSDMTAPEGVFYSAFDADSGGEEGTFYVWRPHQLNELLGKKDGALAAEIFGIDSMGNFEGLTSVPYLPKSIPEAARKLNLEEAQLTKRLDKIRAKLVAARAKRVAPARDEKIVTAWNGLMIAAFADAGRLPNSGKYLKAAEKAANFIWARMTTADGGLHRVFFEGKAELEGALEDYSFMALAAIALFDATSDKLWLERASKLTDLMVTRFQDKEAGDFYRTASVVTFRRGKARNDGQTPSGNSVALEVFAKLSKRSQNPEYRRHGETLLPALSGVALKGPGGNSYTLRAADILLRGETGSRLYLAKGVVRADAAYDASDKSIHVRINIAPGWHINSNKPLEDFFIATELKHFGENSSAAVSYPEAVLRKLGFNDKELAVYEGQVELRLPVSQPINGILKAELRIQACSDKICLEPETAVLSLMPAKS